MANEDINSILEEHGETITIKDISISFDDYGHPTESTSSYSITGLVLIMNAESDEVKEGVLSVGDAVLYVSPSDTNISYVKLNNRFVYNGSEYKIIDIIKEKGVNPGDTWSHFEVRGQKIK